MKKGALISLEALVKLIPHLLLTIGLLFLIGMIMYSLLFPPLTEPQKDFKRLTEDVEDIIENAVQTPQLRITTPMIAKAGYTIAIHYKDSPILPPRCKGAACLCLYEIYQGKKQETCKQYPDFTACSETTYQCGKTLCFSKQPQIVVAAGEPTRVSTNLDCNTIAITT